MLTWASCSLDEEILSIVETESPVTVRYLCALLYPDLAWIEARLHAAEAVRHHCRFLTQQHLLVEVGTDAYRLVEPGRA